MKQFLAVALTALAIVTGAASASELTLYSGRSEATIDPLIQQFQDQTGIAVNVRYGDTAQLAIMLREEGPLSPADLFWAQDVSAMGSLSQRDLLTRLPDEILAGLPAIFTSERHDWVAASGRVRLIAYAPSRVQLIAMPDRVLDLIDDHYAGRVGWAPTEGSFQTFVTAMRVSHGDGATLQWLLDMRNNGTRPFRDNSALLAGIASSEIDYALIDNHYLPRLKAADPDFPVEQIFFGAGDIGNLVHGSAIAIMEGSGEEEAAASFVRFLLSAEAQRYFTDALFEYPVLADIEPHPALESYNRLFAVNPDIDLDELNDLEGTLQLLREANLL